MKYVIFLIICSLGLELKAQDTLYLNQEKIRFFDSLSVYRFNNTPAFSEQQAAYYGEEGDNVFYVKNNTLHNQELIQPGSIDSLVNISPEEVKLFSFTLNSKEVLSLNSAVETKRALGLGTIVCSKNDESLFVWNLSDFQSDLHDTIVNGGYERFESDYKPEIFSINGLTYPATQNDETGYVEGRVGDTIDICVQNSGVITHSMHFHGYHVKIIYSSDGKQTNWIKDTFPVKPGETMRLHLTPHQPGVFPVHDHSLISVTRGMIYPGGMITTLNIAP